MLHAQVPELVADIEANAVGMLVHGIDDIRHQHDKLRAEEFGGEGVEAAIAVQDVGLRASLQLQPIATGDELCVQVGELGFGQLDAIALDMSDQRGLYEQVEYEADPQPDQCPTKGANDQAQPDQQTDRQRDLGKQALTRINELVHLRLPLKLEL